MSTDFEGPSLWHGREINSCVKCKWLNSRIRRYGKNPDYYFYCIHPVVLAGSCDDAHVVMLETAKEKYPDKLEFFTKIFDDISAEIQRNGQFISNDSYGPETPGWCPIIKQKADEAGQE